MVERGEGRGYCVLGPRVGKTGFPSFALEQRVPEREGPNTSRTKDSSPARGAEAGREGSCRVALCPIAALLGAVVKVSPSLSSSARPLQLRRRPAAGAAGLHSLPA